jgi:hypothetical protein
MKMMTIKYRNWELIVDRELTQLTYDKVSNGSAESCNCNDCKNFTNYRESVYPDEIKQLFLDLGIDYKKESEVSHFARLDSGLHFYSGWFHFKGQFIGKDCAIPIQGGSYRTDLYKVSDSFSFGFRSDNALTFFDDKENLVQIEFEAKIPWTIEKELESE